MTSQPTRRPSEIKEKHPPLVEVHVGLLADQVGVPPTNTLDLGQGEHDLATALDVGVEQTQNVLLAGSGARGGTGRVAQ